MYGEEMLTEKEMDMLEELASLVGNNMDAVVEGLQTAEFVSLNGHDIDIDLLDILF